jgi:hypothetical protein
MRTILLALLATLSFTFVAFAADASGKYTGEITTGRGPQPFNIELKQAGGALTGTITGGRGGDLAIADGKVDGDTISFTTTAAGRDGTPVKTTYTGKVSADHIDFTRDNGRGPVTFTAKKQ